MIIGCWTVRGLNDPIKHSALRQLIHQERIAIKARDSLEKKKKGSKASSKKNKKFGSSPEGTSR